MGSAAGDFDGDGDIDFLVTNFQRDDNTLFLNQTPPGGPLRFADETTAAGLNLSTLAFLGWAALALDGNLALFVANGHIYPALRDSPEIGEPYDQPNQLFWTTTRDASPPCSFLASGVPAGARPLRSSTATGTATSW